MDSTQDIILAELRELRSAFNTNAQSTGERLSALESQMKTIVGNGRAGRLENVETDVKGLMAWRWKLLGICTGVSGAVSVAGYFVFHR